MLSQQRNTEPQHNCDSMRTNLWCHQRRTHLWCHQRKTNRWCHTRRTNVWCNIKMVVLWFYNMTWYDQSMKSNQAEHYKTNWINLSVSWKDFCVLWLFKHILLASWMHPLVTSYLERESALFCLELGLPKHCSVGKSEVSHRKSFTESLTAGSKYSIENVNAVATQKNTQTDTHTRTHTDTHKHNGILPYMDAIADGNKHWYYQ